MAVSFTYHDVFRAEDGTGAYVDSLKKATGARTDVASAAASSALSVTGWYRIATDVATYVLIDPSAANGTNGEYWPAGHVEARWIESGNKIGCTNA